jgi:hypothetical protein
MAWLQLHKLTKELRANFARAEDDPLVAGQFFQCHEASSMKFLSAYAYLSAQAKLRSIGEEF